MSFMWWINKCDIFHTKEYYSAVKRNELMIWAATCKNLEKHCAKYDSIYMNCPNVGKTIETKYFSGCQKLGGWRNNANGYGNSFWSDENILGINSCWM